MSKTRYLIIGFLSLCMSTTQAVEILGSSPLYEVGSFFARPAHSSLKKASDAVVLVGGKASGVLVAPGILVTSKHVLTGFREVTNKNCGRIPLFLFHEKEADGTRSSNLRRLVCEEILVNEDADQTAILKVKDSMGLTLPYAEFAKDSSEIKVKEDGFAIGHPYASNFDASTKRISRGKIALHIEEGAEFPHIVHLISTEGGHSGGAITDAKGKVIAIQLGGVTNYGPGVVIDLGNGPEKIHRFNFAVSMPFLYQKYQHLFEQ